MPTKRNSVVRFADSIIKNYVIPALKRWTIDKRPLRERIQKQSSNERTAFQTSFKDQPMVSFFGLPTYPMTAP